MGQPRRTRHEGQGDGEDIDGRLGAGGVFGEAQFGVQAVQLFEEHHPRPIVHLPDEAELGDDIIGHLKRDEDCRHHIGENEHAVLRYLGVGDPFHAPQNGVEKDHHGTDVHPGVDLHLQKAAENQPYPPHLPRHVGETDHDGANHGYRARDIGVVAIADEVWDGELTELA